MTVSAEPDRFIGRRCELGRCADLLSDTEGVRVVTLTGFGGTGKTRLGQRVVRDNASRFHDGAYEVRLSRTASRVGADEVAAAVAASLGLDNQAGLVSSLQRTQDYLAGRQVLLFLDSCEHVLEAVREVVDALVTTCPGVTVLATSRVPLRAVGEHLFPVTALRTVDAVDLFETRAESAGAGQVTESEQRSIHDIVSSVDCIPLSVEIIARRMRYMSAETLLARLKQRRPQGEDNSLDGILQWHDELCSPAERELWHRLSVFRGGFTLTAAEGVCTSDEGQDDVLDLLSGLIDKSVVTFDPGTRRYSMLDRVREYGEQRLRAAGQEYDARLRHLEHYRRHQEKRATAWLSEHEVEYLQEARNDMANLRAALTFAVDNDLGESGMALWLALTRLRVWNWAGLLSESVRLLDQLLAVPSASGLSAETRAFALAQAAQALICAGDPHGAHALARRAEREGGDTSEVVRIAIDHVISAKHAFADHSRHSINEFDALYQRAKKAGAAEDLQFMIRLYGVQPAATHGTEEQAREAGESFMQAAREAGTPWMITWAQWPLALADIRFGQPARARARLREALRTQAGWGERWGPLWFVEAIGWSHPNPVEAARILGAASALRTLCGSEISGFGGWYVQHNAACERIIAAIGQEEFDRAFESGRNMSSYTEIVELALRDPELTSREWEVARLVVQGMSNKEIAEKLTVAPRTAESHVANILSKLGISQRELIADFLPAKE